MLPIPDRQRFASGIHLRQGTRIDAGQGLSVALTVPCNILTAFCSAAAGSLLARWGFSVAVIVFLTLMALSAIAIWVYPPIRRIPKASDWDKISL